MYRRLRLPPVQLHSQNLKESTALVAIDSHFFGRTDNTIKGAGAITHKRTYTHCATRMGKLFAYFDRALCGSVCVLCWGTTSPLAWNHVLKRDVNVVRWNGGGQTYVTVESGGRKKGSSRLCDATG